ncbi:hypothetical protein GCM10020370_08610 [Paenibacillus hodogayensis]
MVVCNLYMILIIPYSARHAIPVRETETGGTGGNLTESAFRSYEDCLNKTACPLRAQSFA